MTVTHKGNAGSQLPASGLTPNGHLNGFVDNQMQHAFYKVGFS